MVQGLAFLSKKSWHTKNLANQEKVWIAEEQKKAEQAKTSELARQIQQEREQDELDRIAGGKSTKLDRGIDWMYHGHEKQSEIAKEDAAKLAEEYLLGKVYVPPSGSNKVTGDLEVENDKQGVNAVVMAAATAPGSITDKTDNNTHYNNSNELTVAQRNEAFRLKLEDPMYAVTLQTVQKEKEIENKRKLYERALGVHVDVVDKSKQIDPHVTGQSKDETDDDNAKRSKKHKKEKKSKKSSKRKQSKKSSRERRKSRDSESDRYSYSSSESSLDSRDRRYSSSDRHYDNNRHRRRSPSIESYDDDRKHYKSVSRNYDRYEDDYGNKKRSRNYNVHDDDDRSWRRDNVGRAYKNQIRPESHRSSNQQQSDRTSNRSKPSSYHNAEYNPRTNHRSKRGYSSSRSPSSERSYHRSERTNKLSRHNRSPSIDYSTASNNSYESDQKPKARDTCSGRSNYYNRERDNNRSAKSSYNLQSTTERSSINLTDFGRVESKRVDGNFHHEGNERVESKRVDGNFHHEGNEKPTGINEQRHDGNREKRYGLQTNTAKPEKGQTKINDLGPDRELIQRKRLVEEREKQNRLQLVAQSRRQQTQQRMSAEERQAALRAMQQDAEKRQQKSLGTNKVVYKDNEYESSAYIDQAIPDEGGSAFLHKVAKAAHGLDQDSRTQLTERLQQTRHTHQRSKDEWLE